MSDLTRIKQAMVDGEHTDGDLEWCVDEIERLTADCEMKDKRIDWTVAANVRNAIEIERLTAERDSAEANLERLQNKFEQVTGENARLTAELANANNSFGCQTANWPGLAGRIEDLKRRSNERWRDNERLQARVESLTAENKRLRAVYEAAKDAVEQNPPYVTLWLEGEVEAIAATEQG